MGIYYSSLEIQLNNHREPHFVKDRGRQPRAVITVTQQCPLSQHLLIESFSSPVYPGPHHVQAISWCSALAKTVYYTVYYICIQVLHDPGDFWEQERSNESKRWSNVLTLHPKFSTVYYIMTELMRNTCNTLLAILCHFVKAVRPDGYTNVAVVNEPSDTVSTSRSCCSSGASWSSCLLLAGRRRGAAAVCPNPALSLISVELSSRVRSTCAQTCLLSNCIPFLTYA